MTPRTRRILWTLVITLLLLLLVGFGVVPRVVGGAMNRTLDGAAGPVGAEAERIHGTLAGADLHADALLWDRDLLARGSWGHVDVPRLIEGHMAVQAFTVVTKTPRGMNIEANTGDSDNITLLAVLERWPPRAWGSLAERALVQADKLQRFAADSDGRLAFVRSREDLEGFLARRDANEETVAGFLGLEGAHALEGDLANVDRLYQAGFRMFGLTHFFDNAV
ncbi:MAG TPA: membrane dipeptidase, partial [Longimicrobiales bacterium]|nr:membrane dipeptidase [Longimicrobiales bacterium]